MVFFSCLHDEVQDVAHASLVEDETTSVGLQMRCEELHGRRVS